MILLEVPPKLIIYKSDIFITICQCEKCICNDLLHYAYTYYTNSYTLYNMNFEFFNDFRWNWKTNPFYEYFECYFSILKILNQGKIRFCKFLSSIKSWVDGQDIKWWGIVINLFFGQLVSGKVQKVSFYLPHLI